MQSVTPVITEAYVMDEFADEVVPLTYKPQSITGTTTTPTEVLRKEGDDVPTATPVYVIQSLPPPNTPAGGVWEKQNFRGAITAAATVGGFLVACLPGLLMLIFRLDRRDAYLATDGNLYDARGKLLGSAKTLKFVPDKPRNFVVAHPV
jgi:hypothetical protein